MGQVVAVSVTSAAASRTDLLTLDLDVSVVVRREQATEPFNIKCHAAALGQQTTSDESDSDLSDVM